LFNLSQGFAAKNEPMRALLLPLAALLLSGCLARTAVELATLPVRVASAGVDAVTTSQAEADQRRGRQIREEEERLGREARRRERKERRAAERATEESPE
jgi:uncharacterized lipoprotein YajG